MSNFEKLNIKPVPEIDRIASKTRFEYELAESGQTMIPGPLAAFEVYRTTYRDLAFTMYEECSDGDRIGGSQDEATLVHAVMRLTGIGAAGTAATALSMAGDIGKIVGKIGLKAGSIGVLARCLALTGTGKVLGSLARAAMKQSIKLNPDLDLKAAHAVTEFVVSSKAVKRVHPGKSNLRMNQFEAALIVSKGKVISIIGPLGIVFVERSKDSKDREMFMIIADEELTVRRTVKEAVDMGLHLAGLSVGSQIEGAVHSVASTGLGIVGKGSKVLGNGLNALAGSFVKMGALLIK